MRTENETLMFRLIRAGHLIRERKTLLNGLRNDGGLGLTREQAEGSPQRLRLPETVRGETLGLEEYAALADYISRWETSKK